ncbi:MAG: SPFH domain-containing protein [Ruminococcaceae bacterium]|nr:SPFH domain-containing protein [Oscillospiraceae bacterium]
MGLIKAGLGAVGGVLADQWKEFFYCDAMDVDVLIRKGQKRTSGRSSNTKGSDNVISNGSGIAVADGQCMIIVEQGKVVEFCAEPGEYKFDSSTEPSLFTGKLGDSLKETFKTIGKRFTYGGDTGKDQRVYYFNLLEIMDNKFGTPNPFMFKVVNKDIGMSRTVQIRCNGVYSYRITDPMLLYTKVAGNITDEYTRDKLDSQLKTEFIDALQPAFAKLSALALHPAEIPAHTAELKQALNEALKLEWSDRRGISVESVALNPITLTPEDMEKINKMEDAATMGQNPFMMAGRMTDATANAMETAAGNEAGAMTGFMGMGMAGNAMGGGFNAAQSFFNMGQQQQAAAAVSADSWKCACGAMVTGKFCTECGAAKPAPADSWKCACGAMVTGKFCTECGAPKPAQASGWSCSCGTVNQGKFCQNCGAKKPEGAPLYRCDKCGWKPEDPHNPPKFCPECGDLFDDNDIQ